MSDGGCWDPTFAPGRRRAEANGGCWCAGVRDYRVGERPPYTSGCAYCGDCGRYLSVLQFREVNDWLAFVRRWFPRFWS